MADNTADLPHDNIQSLVVTLVFVFPVVATIALALRLYSRTLTRNFAAGMKDSRPAIVQSSDSREQMIWLLAPPR